jgi:CRP-like cAMP-binding protein
MGSIDGLPTPVPRMLRPPPFKTHLNGATGLDHVVILSGSLDRTARALARAGVELKRIPRTANVTASSDCVCALIDGTMLLEALADAKASSTMLESARTRLALTDPSVRSGDAVTVGA